MTPILVAICAASVLAAGNAVQHRAAGVVPESHGVVALLAALMRSPQWLLGSSLAFGGFLLHVLALNLGVVAVVQPIMLAAVLLAVPMRAALDRTLPTRSEMLWVAFTVVGIVIFVAVANPDQSPGEPRDGRALAVAIVGVSLAVLWAQVATRADRAAVRGFVYATAAGGIFGITAGLMKFVKHDAEQGVGGLVSDWHLWALIVGSLIATTMNQRAYQAVKLSVVMPSCNSINILVALGVGWYVFDEAPGLSPSTIIVQGICLVAMVYGLYRVAIEEEAAEARQHDSGQVRPSVS